MSEPRTYFPEDEIHPVVSNGGGVYSVRSGQYSLKTPSVRAKKREVDIEEASNDEKDTVDERDVKKRQVFTGWTLLWLAYQSTGIIYGDIGTSPLYVYSSTFDREPSNQDLLGALSLIIWSITLMVTVKYICIVLRADDEGEGGTFALYSLLSRYARIVRRDPREESRVKMERFDTGQMRPANKIVRSFIEHSRVVKIFLKVIGVFGVSFVLSDGILTPSQSVLGAIQGLNVVDENITNATIVGVSCAILVLLFLIQPFGTSKIASSFAPIVIIWLLFNLAFGIYNLIKHDASVLKAFSPFFAGDYLVRNKTKGWDSLGGILLAFTGVEALFADLGAFSRRAVQLSWLCFAYPCLLLAYIGQAAYISEHPSAYTNPFFNSVPPGMFYPSLVIAILAAIVASQAMITSAFQLLSQMMKLSYFPQIKTVHTSKIFYGQIYIPLANWLMMIGTIIVTVVYNNTTRLGHAYGVCVILVTFITTCMVTVVALIVWRLPVIVVAIGFLVFGALDGAFLSSALTKVPDGAWFTLLLAVVLAAIFILWRFGKEQQWQAEASDRFPPSRMLDIDTDCDNDRSIIRLKPAFGGSTVTPMKGLGIFFDKAGSAMTTPTVFIHFLQKFQAAPEFIVFFHLRPLSVPTVPVEERYTVTRCFASSAGKERKPIPNCFRLVVRHGYMDVVISSDLGILVVEQIRRFLISEAAGPTAASTTNNGSKAPTIATDSETGSATTHPASSSEAVQARLAALQRAYDDRVIYIVGKEQMRIKDETNFVRSVALTAFLWLRDNTRTKIQSLNVEVQRLVEVGFVKEI